jgi:hypothetical protein
MGGIKRELPNTPTGKFMTLLMDYDPNSKLTSEYIRRNKVL